MDKQTINHISRTAPVVLSLLAFGVVTAGVATGWEKGYSDEGSAAHIFQLLIVAEVPFLLTFVATADWKRAGRVAAQIGLQAAALALALCTCGYLQIIGLHAARVATLRDFRSAGQDCPHLSRDPLAVDWLGANK